MVLQPRIYNDATRARGHATVEKEEKTYKYPCVSLSFRHANVRITADHGHTGSAQRIEIIHIIHDILDCERQDFHAHLAQIRRGYVPDQLRERVPVTIDLFHGQGA